jgi:hypothetical protein
MERTMEPVTPSDPVTGPLWPSDHAGVAATLAIHVTADGRELPWAVVNDDPLRPNEQALFVVGTDHGDDISIDQCYNGDLVVTMLNPWERRVFQPTLGSNIYVHSSAGNDNVTLSSRVTHNTIVFAGDGNDCVYGGRGDDEIYGGDGCDWLIGGAGDDILDGGSGCDFLFGCAGADDLSGGDGTDFLFGGAGSDSLIGGQGNDWLFGGSGDDDLDGGDGTDWLFGGSGRDSLTRGEHSFS